MPVDTLTEQQHHRLLGDACARNQPIEVQFDTIDGQAKTAKSRFLRMENTFLLIERPTIKGALAKIPPQSMITVSYSVSGDRYRFRSRTGEVQPFRLNEKVEIKSLEIVIPSHIDRRQRRSDFRISLAGSGSIFATLEPQHWKPKASDTISGEETEAPTPPKIPVRLANLSAGGTAVVFDTNPKHRVRSNQKYWIEFELPNDDESFRIGVEIKHVKKQKKTETTILGLKFIMEPTDLRIVKQRIAKFIAREQRRQLRNRR